MQKGQGPPHSVGKFPGHPEKDRGQQGPGTATCAPWPGKPQPDPAAFGTGPRSTSGPRPARLHLNPDPGLGQRVPHRCPLPLPSLTKGQALLYSHLRDAAPRPTEGRSLSSADPPLPKSLPAGPWGPSTPEAPPAPAWHGHRSSCSRPGLSSAHSRQGSSTRGTQDVPPTPDDGH